MILPSIKRLCQGVLTWLAANMPSKRYMVEPVSVPDSLWDAHKTICLHENKHYKALFWDDTEIVIRACRRPQISNDE